MMFSKLSRVSGQTPALLLGKTVSKKGIKEDDCSAVQRRLPANGDIIGRCGGTVGALRAASRLCS